ncbi:MAG: wax ester/triacylglycerol synthase family O-acyltransferase [Nocardioides sp.]|nr:wax ester/triacylglycerol synthase family O-acyltransferase [Nocardioides sp.]
MDRLTGLDASFLYLETPEQLMHVSGLLLIDPATMPGGYDFASLRDAIGRRVRDEPTFTRKLRRVPLGLDHPIWVEDTHFDIERHVHRLAVPSPGTERELAEVVGHLTGLVLDWSRPLWEMWVIEGLASGHVAVLTKMHHASVDGVNGATALSFLCGLEPDAALLDVGSDVPALSRVPGLAELAAKGVLATVTWPVRLASMVGPTVNILAGAARRSLRGRAMAAPLTAPRTSFNATITGHRSVAWCDMDLERIKEIKRAVDGATVNDVVLSVAGGALRRYLADRGELPETSLLATVPVSVHGRSRSEHGRNKVSSLFTRLGTDVADPLERLRQLSVVNRHAKDHHRAIPADTLQDFARLAAPGMFALATRAVSTLRLADRGPVIHNLIISNVPGPPVPLYFMGARIDGLYPLGPIFHGAGLNITAMSSNGRMHVGVIACRESVPRPWELTEAIEKELDALGAALL